MGIPSQEQAEDLLVAFMVVVPLVAIVFILVIAWFEKKWSVEYWAQVHKNNQDKIKRDRLKEFESKFHVPVQYRSRREKGAE